MPEIERSKIIPAIERMTVSVSIKFSMNYNSAESNASAEFAVDPERDLTEQVTEVQKYLRSVTTKEAREALTGSLPVPRQA